MPITKKIESLDLKKKLLIGFSTPLILIGIITVTVLFSLSNLLVASGWVNHTYQAISLGDSITNSLINMETGLRGFLVAGKEEFLEPYHTGEKRFSELMNEAQLKVSDNPKQVERLQKVEKMKHQWFKDHVEPAMTYRREVSTGALAASNFKKISARTVGKEKFDHFRKALNELKQKFKKNKDFEGILLIDNILIDMINQETGQRGYLLSGQEQSLEPYESGIKSFQTNVENMYSLIESRYGKNTLKEFENLIKIAIDWRTNAANPEIQARREMNNVTRTLEDITSFIETGIGKSYMDGMRAILNDFTAEEARLINIRNEEQKKTASMTASVTIGGAIITLVIGVLMTTYITRIVIRQSNKIKENEARISLLAQKDCLTGTYNRRAFVERLNEIQNQSKRHGNFFSILYLDLDQFKQLNDTRGHDAGDQLLIELTNRLTSQKRQEDVLARMGGDEFVLLLTNFSSIKLANKHSADIAEKIIKSLTKPFIVQETDYFTTCSIGIVIGGQGIDDDTERLLKNADLAMYRSKKIGGNHWQFFDSNLQKHATERTNLEQRLKHDIEQNNIQINYQPIVDFNSAIIGFEILPRWQHDTGNFASPETLNKIAEESHLIIQLDEFMLRKACEQLVEWSHDSGRKSWTISVNMSAKLIQQQDFLERILGIIHNAGAKPCNIILEVNESLLQDNISQTIQILKQLSVNSIRFTLDKFGTGHCSLTSLKNLPFQFLKLDKAFINNVLNDKDDAAITKMIISLSERINKIVIVEGVETREQFDYFKTINCQRFQGEFFSIPLEKDEIEQWLQQEQIA